MFLATNLQNTIDEAVLGRVSIKYNYDKLQADARSKIWKAHLSKSNPDLSHLQFNVVAQNDLNGRQV